MIKLTVKTTTALLAVSKLIRTETIPILYGKNLWRLPHCQDVYGIFYKHQLSFRRVTIVYKQCNLPQNRKLQIKHLVHSISDIEFATGKSVAPHPQGSHKTCMAEMYVLWRESRRTLSGLQGVNEITITLQHFPWASGCLPFLVSEEGWRVLWGMFPLFHIWLESFVLSFTLKRAAAASVHSYTHPYPQS